MPGRKWSVPNRRRIGQAWASGPAAAGLAAPPGSFARLVPAWLSALAVLNYAEASRQTWSVALGLFAAWCADRGLTEAGQVTRAVMESYQRHLYRSRSGRARGPGHTRTGEAAPAEGQPLAIRTQRSHLHAVDRFFSWAVRRGLVPANPAADLELPRQPKPLPDYLTAAEAEAVLSACRVDTPDGLRDRAFLELLHSTGLRRLEALRLGVGDVDPSRGVVHVWSGKGRKERYSPIGSRALGWLHRYQDEVRSRWCRDPAQQALFLDRSGQPLGGGTLGARVHRLLRQAGIRKRGSCHLFRHGFATGLVEAGCDLRLIAAMLGHGDIGSTMLYTRVGVGQLCAAHRLYHEAAAEAAKAGGASSGPESGQDPSQVTP